MPKFGNISVNQDSKYSSIHIGFRVAGDPARYHYWTAGEKDGWKPQDGGTILSAATIHKNKPTGEHYSDGREKTKHSNIGVDTVFGRAAIAACIAAITADDSKMVRDMLTLRAEREAKEDAEREAARLVERKKALGPRFFAALEKVVDHHRDAMHPTLRQEIGNLLMAGRGELCTYPDCSCIVSTSTSAPEPVCPHGLPRA